MPNLKRLIGEWRNTMETEARFRPEVLDELENHLSEKVEHLMQSGLTMTDAFAQAVGELGTAPTIASEFRKLQEPIWWPTRLVIGLGLAAVAAFATFSIMAYAADARPSRSLLALHVFMVGLGYTTTLLIGALGICYVSQRSFSDFSPARPRWVARLSFKLSCIAAVFTATGILLAMIWAKAEWGRYWAWDIKESGALAILLWQVTYWSMHRLARDKVHGILLTSLLGNIVVSLGWFGTNLLSRSHGDWALPDSLLLLAAIVFNLLLFIAGFAPAGWLRIRSST